MNFSIRYKVDYTDKQFKYDFAMFLVTSLIFASTWYFVVWYKCETLFEVITYGIGLLIFYTLLSYQVIPRFVKKYIKE